MQSRVDFAQFAQIWMAWIKPLFFYVMISFDPTDGLVNIIFPAPALAARWRQLIVLRHPHPKLDCNPVHVAARVSEDARVL